jgi:hypothetical protein
VVSSEVRTVTAAPVCTPPEPQVGPGRRPPDILCATGGGGVPGTGFEGSDVIVVNTNKNIKTHSFIMKMEAMRRSETLRSIYLTTRRHVLEDRALNTEIVSFKRACFSSIIYSYVHKIKEKQSFPCNRPWRPIGLLYVEDPTLSRQSAHRWR